MDYSEHWSKGPGEFYVQSKSTVVNRRSEPTDTLDNTSFNQFSSSYQRKERGERTPFSSARSQNARSVDSNGMEIRVNVGPNYPTIEVPINNPQTPNRNWIHRNYDDSRQLSGNNYGGIPQIVNPPTVRYNTINGSMNLSHMHDSESFHSRRTVSRNNTGRVISQMQIPPLTPNMSIPIRNIPKFESYRVDSDESNSRRRTHLRNEPPYPTLREQSMPALRERNYSRSKSRCHHCHHCRRHRAHSSSSRHNKQQPTPNDFGSAYAYANMYTPTIPFCPHCQSGMNTMTPFTPFHAPQNGIFSPVIMPPIQYVPSPMPQNFNSLPRRLSKRTNTRGASTPTPMHQSMIEKPITPYHCVCCPEGQHKRASSRNNPAFFATDSEGNISDVNVQDTRKYPPTLPRSTNNRSIRNSPYQPSSLQKSYFEQHIASDNETLRSKATSKPSSYVVTVQDAQQSPSPGIETGESPQFIFREKNTKNSSMKHENSWSVEKHGSVIRDDGFPNDYVDLIDTATEFATEEDKDDAFPLDKLLVVTLAEASISNANSPSQVAGNLKKSMDERFSPVWQVVAGTGAYGSNIASINGKLLHFKAFGWAFLIWKTA